MARSERLNKLGDSWFSSKAIEVAPREWLREVEHCFGKGAVLAYQADANSECPITESRETHGGC